MKLFLSLLVFLLAVYACNPVDRDLDIPDKVDVVKTPKHQQIPGTRLFIVIPPGYKFTETSGSLRKSDGCEIQVMDGIGNPFDRDKEVQRTSQTTSGELTFYKKNFSFGGYDANIRYGKIKRENRERIFLTFGDSQFTVLVMCILPDDNKEARQEMVNALKTIFVDKSVQIDYAAFNNYSLDLTHSAFKFNKNAALLFYYTVDGKGDADSNYVIIARIPALPRIEEMEGCAKALARRFAAKMTDIDTDEERISIGGQPAYRISMKGMLANQPKNVYLVVMGNQKSSVYFMGYVDGDKAELYKDCRALAQTLRLK